MYIACKCAFVNNPYTVIKKDIENGLPGDKLVLKSISGHIPNSGSKMV